MSHMTQPLDYYGRLERSCNGMGIEKWRAIKGVIYAILISFIVAVSRYRPGSIVVPMTGMIVMLLIFGLEVKEVEIANWATIRMYRPNRNGDSNGESDK